MHEPTRPSDIAVIDQYRRELRARYRLAFLRDIGLIAGTPEPVATTDGLDVFLGGHRG